MAAEHDLECNQYDVIAAFLKAMMDDHNIYVEMHHGFADRPEKVGMVCLLLMALYGLKQAPLLWYAEFTKFMRSHGYNPFMSDSCVFSNGTTIVVVYVDDLLIFASLISSVEAAALLIGARFAMRSLGPLHYYLGMRIIRDRSKRRIMIVQDGYLDSVALKFAQELAPLLPQTTPLGKTTADALTIAAEGYEAPTAIKTLYQTLVGTAVWPAMISRPDCCYEVGLLCRFLKNPTPAHLDAIITVLRYLVGTKTLGMLFQGSTTGAGELNVHAFTDASWGDDKATRRSTGGTLIKIAGAPLFYKSGRQTVVVLS
ncbi:hypothetical protein TI39_contig4419g00005 [Zymoseptoria brevis]|uniref:Reverse transcriptase Ty1/copia-type domain-containing protein n=1 Tax=Zymoseptoria brevis TaxID=1047168 RepID=A0A0F4G6T4_9PEZI|nr:hypothetical protein TI39_contig4419g00005 [Zymoseptoria brevis]